MAKVTRPCPKCQYPLAIPQPVPERFMCPKCGVVMKRKSTPQAAAVQAAPAQAAPVQAAPRPMVASVATAVVPSAATGSSPKRQLLILGGILSVLLGSIVVLLIVLLGGRSGGDSKPEQPGPGDGSSGPTLAANNQKAPNASNAPRDRPRPSDAGIPKSLDDDKRWPAIKPHFDKGKAYLIEQTTKKRKEQQAEQKEGRQLLLWGSDWERGEGLASKPWGVVALLGLTLLECGVASDDENILWLAAMLEANAAELKHTHSTAASVLFLCRWHESKPLEESQQRLLKSLALRLIAGQLEHGEWWSDLPLLNAAQEKQLIKDLADGSFRPSKQGPGTVSNTSFAMQALWSARKHDIPVRTSLIAAAGHFQRTQLPDGSWAFSAAVKDRFFASATCAGLIALGMEKAILNREPRPFVPSEKTADPALAFTFLARTIGDDGTRATFEDKETVAGRLFMADAWGDIFYLWALERVALIYDRNTIESRDWYDWGSSALKAAQNPDDGSWNDRHGSLVDTCFAVMFLKRSNLCRDLTEKLRELETP